MNNESAIDPTGDEPGETLISDLLEENSVRTRPGNDGNCESRSNVAGENLPPRAVQDDVSRKPADSEEEEEESEEEEMEGDDDLEGEMEFGSFWKANDDDVSDASSENAEDRQMRFLRQQQKYHSVRLLGRNKDPELPSSVARLRLQHGQHNAIVYLIGTAHFSEVSNKEVSDLIEAVSPDYVVLELDKSRSHILFMDEERLMNEAKSLNFAAVKEMAAKQGVSYAVMHYLLLRMSASLVEQLGMAPGGEFRAALRSAVQVPDCTIFFGDRPVRLTLQRAFGQLPFFSRLRLALSLLCNMGPISREDVESLKQSDLLEAMMKELGVEFPVLSRVIVEERDLYLARSIYKLASRPLTHVALLEAAKGEVTREPVVLVAVVGLGHVAGIVRHWDEAEHIDLHSLRAVPVASRAETLARRGVKWALIGGFFYGGYCLLARLAGVFFGSEGR